MIMADVFKILFLILGVLIVTVAYWLLFEALFRRIVERASVVYECNPCKVVMLGVLVSVPLFLVSLGLLQSAAGLKLLGAVLVSGILLVGLLGSAGLARLVGARLVSATDGAYPWRRVLRGGVVLSITFVLPVVGWFFVLPLTLASGVGAVILSRKGDAAAQPATTPVAPAANA
ncbi:MAG: hypothetical protein IT365_20965 [Candidatus Hydrogenedentes bacterium]|nr:hypothetical protein [Candidatus Hydrogenedentota bacterium]